MIATLIVLGVAVTIVLAMFIQSYVIRKQMVLYQINKGNHYSIRPLSDLIKLPIKLGYIKSNSLSFDFIVGTGSMHDPSDKSVHKLYGICFGFDPHYRSLRIGWRHVGGGDIQLFSYVYNGGVRQSAYLYTVSAYLSYHIRLAKLNDKEYSIELFGYAHSTATGTFGRVKYVTRTVNVAVGRGVLKFKLFPYYGGQKVASENVKIYIKEV